MVARVRAVHDLQRRQGADHPVTVVYRGRLLHLCGAQGHRLHATVIKALNEFYLSGGVYANMKNIEGTSLAFLKID